MMTTSRHTGSHIQSMNVQTDHFLGDGKLYQIVGFILTNPSEKQNNTFHIFSYLAGVTPTQNLVTQLYAKYAGKNAADINYIINR